MAHTQRKLAHASLVQDNLTYFGLPTYSRWFSLAQERFVPAFFLALHPVMRVNQIQGWTCPKSNPMHLGWGGTCPPNDTRTVAQHKYKSTKGACLKEKCLSKKVEYLYFWNVAFSWSEYFVWDTLIIFNIWQGRWLFVLFNICLLKSYLLFYWRQNQQEQSLKPYTCLYISSFSC